MLRTAYGWLKIVENGFPVSDGFLKGTCHSEVEERNSKSFLLDVAATDANHEAHMITDGLAGAFWVYYVNHGGKSLFRWTYCRKA